MITQTSTLELPAQAQPDEAARDLQTAEITRKVVLLNGLIAGCLIINEWAPEVAYIGGLLVLVYLSLVSLLKPQQGFFLIFGVKLTFDTLWSVGRHYTLGPLHLLSMFIIPMLILVLRGPRIRNPELKWIVYLVAVYLFWVVLATVANGLDLGLELMVRQGSILLGLLIGLKYIGDEHHFDFLVAMVFLSTLIPMAATLFQFLMHSSGYRALHYTMDSVRGMRFAGPYYDTATAGMVNLISLVSNAYLILRGIVQAWKRNFHLGFLAVSFFLILIGATRSMMMTSSFLLAILISSDLKKWVRAIPFLLLVLYFGQPYIESAVDRSIRETTTTNNLVWDKLLTSQDYRRMLTGRMSLWQDIWSEFEDESPLQQALGSGEVESAHSTYFYLLLQIGYLGLLYYVFIQFNIFLFLIKSRARNKMLNILALLLLTSVIFLGISTNMVIYTSYQWIAYMLIGGVMNIVYLERDGRGQINSIA